MWIKACLAAIVFAASGASAQIAVDTLDEAKPFAPGAQIEGLRTLDPNAWQGTSADRAVALLDAAPTDSADPVVRQLLRRVALSGLVPPENAGGAFDTARLRVAQAVTTPSEYDSFARRNPTIANDPRIRADAALANGDLPGACAISDQLTEGRGETYWVRLRAACHDSRGETAAADLAKDILRDRGESVTLDIPEQRTDFWGEVERNLHDFQYLRSLVDESAFGDGAMELPEVADAVPDGERGAKLLLGMSARGDAVATARFARRAESEGLDPHAVLDALNVVLDPLSMVQSDLPLYADHAAVLGDIGLMQALYAAATDDVRQPLALASDALGGGYRNRPLGEGLDAALTSPDARAVRDAVLAIALGADMSDAADDALSALTYPQGAPNLVALTAAAEAGSRAEVLLRTARILEDDGASHPLIQHDLLRALQRAGFYDLAGQLAARDMLKALPR